MADPGTREAIATVLKGECPIVAAWQAAGKPLKCRYFGFTEGCNTCTYPWESIADEAINQMDRRVANVEAERRGRIKAERERDTLLEDITRALEPYREVVDGYRTKFDLGCVEVDEGGNVRVPESFDGGGDAAEST